jgi:hypothetical protein
MQRRSISTHPPLASLVNYHQHGEKHGSANGIRTRVTAVRGRCPRPLDDSASDLHAHSETGRAEHQFAIFAWSTSPEQAILFPSPAFFPCSLSPLLATTRRRVPGQYSAAWDRMGTELVFGGGVLRYCLGQLFGFQLRPQRKELVAAWRTANGRQLEPPAQR